MGALVAPLAAGFEGRWDRGDTLSLTLNAGGLSSLSEADVLNGANRLAIETYEGWEVLAFSTAELGEDEVWTLSGLLRGLGGTLTSGAPVGARVVVLDGAGAILPVNEHEIDSALTVLAVPPGKALNDNAVRSAAVVYDAIERRPLAPVHLNARWNGSDFQLSWIRRARVDADAWGYGEVGLDEAREAYEVTLLDGGEIKATIQVTDASYTLSEADRSVFFPAGLQSARFKVAQISDAYGPGRAAEASFAPVN